MIIKYKKLLLTLGALVLLGARPGAAIAASRPVDRDAKGNPTGVLKESAQ
jgi:hypothetical protein